MSSDLCGKLELDVEIKASAEQFHHMLKHKPHHLHTTTDKIQGCELHQGQWGTVGSVIVWNYFYNGKPAVSKDLIEDIDDEKNSITFKVIEGHHMEHFKSIKATCQVTPKSNGQGSVVHWTVIYEKLHKEILDPHPLLDLVHGASKDLEAHLLQKS